MARLSITLFGPFRVGLDGEAVDAFKSNKVRGLLAYLAVESPRVRRRDSLAALLWLDWPDKEARTNLRYALSNLRSAIGDREAETPFLNITRETIKFNKDSDHWVDVGKFAQLLSASKAGTQEIDRLVESVNLYQGKFLEGFSISDSPPYQEWTLLKREQLHRQLVDALRQLSAAYEGKGEFERAVLIRQFGYAEPTFIFDIVMSPDGLTALSGSSERTIVQWRLDNPTLDELVS